MDYARKIGKGEKPRTWRKRPSPPSSIIDRPLVYDEEVSEDRRLVNWRKWLTDRKKFRGHCSKYTDRNDGDPLIDASDNFRRKVETKELAKIALESAKKKKDKYGCDPGFWAIPELLPNRGNPDLPDVFITLTKQQLNIEPEVELIALPELTRQEKGSSSSSSQYEEALLRKQREKSKRHGEKSPREVKSVESNRSGLDKLSVKGTSLAQRKCESPRVPVITITGVESFERQDDRNLRQEDVVALKIQDREIKLVKSKKWSNEKSSDELAWSLIFLSSEFNITERTIRLENRGTFAINYSWRRCFEVSTSMPQTSHDSSFFFNKNKEIILPGQVTVLRVWFQSRVPCSATELWTLMTDPELRRAPLLFRLWGCCSADVERHFDNVERYLDRRVRDTEIQEIIREILENVHQDRRASPAYGSLFLESEIFEAKNPSYFYHPSAIIQLRELHECSIGRDSLPWSLSLDDLRRDLAQLTSPGLKNEALGLFNELSRRCLGPSLHSPAGTTKRAMVNNLLCSFVNKFETEEEYVRAECSQRSNIAKAGSDLRGDTSSSTSASRMSQKSLTPRRKIKKNGRMSSLSRISSKSSAINENREVVLPTSERRLARERLLYREVFHTRIRGMLMDTIERICGVIDTANNL